MVVRGKTLIQKTLFLSASHFAVRSVGFLLRLWLSRELGAQTMGLVELAQSAQMLLITPVVTGLPVAVSRMCAKTEGARRVRVVRCTLLLALPVSLLIAALAFLFREPLCLWLGDVQTLPALLCFLPCIPILGASCVLNGYYYGIGQPVPPAVSELLEQIVRALLCVRLVYGLRGWPTLFHAAIPAVATLAGETAGLILMLVLGARLVLFAQGEGSRKPVFRELLALSLPLTGMRLVSSLMQTVNATLIPARLQLFGLSAAEAMASLGVFHGMLKPILFMPSFITCSLSMAAAPELTKRQTDGQPLCTLSTRMILASLAIGAAASAGVWLFAPLIANFFFRQAALLPLLRGSCALIPIIATTHVCGGIMNALGLQGASLKISLASGLLGVMTVQFLVPVIGLWGAVVSLGAVQGLTLLLSLLVLRRSGCIARSR